MCCLWVSTLITFVFVYKAQFSNVGLETAVQQDIFFASYNLWDNNICAHYLKKAYHLVNPYDATL